PSARAAPGLGAPAGTCRGGCAVRARSRAVPHARAVGMMGVPRGPRWTGTLAADAAATYRVQRDEHADYFGARGGAPLAERRGGDHAMAKIGTIGSGEMGSQLARAAIRRGHAVVIANSRGPESLRALTAELGTEATAATARVAAAEGDFVIIAVPLKLVNDMPVDELAGKIVLDTNNHMPWR